MEPGKVALLFGDLPSGVDPDDPDDRGALFAQRGPSQAWERHGSRWNMLLGMVATQIADDDPPQVWHTAERLLAGGMDPQQVLGQLMLALSMCEPASWEDLPLGDYRAALARLPAPGAR